MSSFSRDFPATFADALQEAREELGKNSLLIARGTIETEAEQLVEAAFRKATGQRITRMDLFSRARDAFPRKAAELLLVMATRRAGGELLQHLTGYQQFLGHEYEVSADVLVPRPETELLVERAVARLSEGIEPQLGLEVGLGSGVISIELLNRFKGLRMMASELSQAAAAVARKNAESVLGRGALGTRLEILSAAEELEVLEPFIRSRSQDRADFLISNPPYLLSEDETEEEVWKHEPAEALFAPEGDPLHFYRRIAEGARSVLRNGAFVFLELPHERASEISKLFADAGFRCMLLRDLTGRERFLEASVLL